MPAYLRDILKPRDENLFVTSLLRRGRFLDVWNHPVPTTGLAEGSNCQVFPSHEEICCFFFRGSAQTVFIAVLHA